VQLCGKSQKKSVPFKEMKKGRKKCPGQKGHPLSKETCLEILEARKWLVVGLLLSFPSGFQTKSIITFLATRGLLDDCRE
jgi:hypothetical protein